MDGVTAPGWAVARRLRTNWTGLAGAGLVGAIVIAALFAPWLAPSDPNAQDLAARRRPPEVEHLLGTDELGRDILSRIVFGSRVSLTVGVGAVGAAALVGVPLGLLAGYRGGLSDMTIMRLVDLLLSFPHILLAILVVAVLGPSLWNVVAAVGLWNIPIFARMARSSTLRIRELAYVEAAVANGASTLRVLSRHIFPNALGPLVVTATLSLGAAILTESGLSFLGLGVQPPTPSWGMMLSTGKAYLRGAYHIATFPGIAIMLTVLGFNFLGDWLRDALDPSSR
jgi:ABC-type dipeptide/oligopeptide/nickel transport system permease subunit